MEGEEQRFSGTIIDDGYTHVLKIYRDRKTGMVRLQASVFSGDMQNAPVWTAFVTDSLYSESWKRKAGHTVYLADIQHVIFTSNYRPRFRHEGFPLDFANASDADSFCDAVDSLTVRQDRDH